MATQPVQRRGYDTIDSYTDLWKKGENQESTDSTERKEKYTTLVNAYYDLATDFYEWGWGLSFHFAPRHRGESLQASIARHEHFLALRLGLKPGMKVLDVGCGVGGPMMEIARFSGATVVGINNNAYQVSRGEKHVKSFGLTGLASFVKGDFMHLPFPDNTFDSIYAIEAICHAPDKVGIYTELMRVLKPGGKFACYEWCLTDKFDHNNKTHLEIKENIEVGDGLPDIDTTQHVLESLSKAGFRILESNDFADPTPINPISWVAPFEASYFSLSGLRSTPLGINLTHYFLSILERVGLSAKGTVSTHTTLMRARD